MTMRTRILSNDINGIQQALADNPALANEGIPYDENNTTKALPLHRICDAVFIKKITGDEAVLLANIFLEHGADINGGVLVIKKDTPLIAAASLYADKVAILLIEKGADIQHAGTHGGTALHWAAWCGRDSVVSQLVNAGAAINKRCIDFNSTPLFWTVHGYKSGNNINNLSHYLSCADILLKAGADPSIPNSEGKTVFDLLTPEDGQLNQLLRRV